MKGRNFSAINPAGRISTVSFNNRDVCEPEKFDRVVERKRNSKGNTEGLSTGRIEKEGSLEACHD